MEIPYKNIIAFLESLLVDLEERRYDRCIGMVEGALSIFEILERKTNDKNK